MKSNLLRSWPQKRHESSMTYTVYLAVAFLLGLGAPAGSLLFQYITLQAADFRQWANQEWKSASWFYFYMTIGTTAVFMAAGWLAAMLHIRLKRKAERLASIARSLEDMAVKDPLSGLYNFHSVKSAVGVELERSRRFGAPLSCLLVDIDHLKEINAECGHPAGDSVVKAVAQILDRNLRIIDTPSRFGGDEFFVLLPSTSREGAMAVAERLKKQVRKMAVRAGAFTVRTRITIGIAGYPSLGIEDTPSLIKAAEQQLKTEKEHLQEGQRLLARNSTDVNVHRALSVSGKDF